MTTLTKPIAMVSPIQQWRKTHGWKRWEHKRGPAVGQICGGCASALHSIRVVCGRSMAAVLCVHLSTPGDGTPTFHRATCNLWQGKEQ